MKKTLILLLVSAFAANVYAARFDVGFSPSAFGRTSRVTGCLAYSTNTTQAVSVQAVYPISHQETVERQEIKTERLHKWVDSVETLTNWCENITANFVVVDGITNYYASVTVSTNSVPVSYSVSVTNKFFDTKTVITRSLTNDLYSLTCAGGFASSNDVKIIGEGAAILVSGAAVDLAID